MHCVLSAKNRYKLKQRGADSAVSGELRVALERLPVPLQATAAVQPRTMSALDALPSGRANTGGAGRPTTDQDLPADAHRHQSRPYEHYEYGQPKQQSNGREACVPWTASVVP